MKKNISVILSVVCAAMMCSCGNSGGAAPAETSAVSETTEAETSAASETSVTSETSSSESVSGETSAEETEETKDQNEGEDWRTTGVIDGYGSIIIDSGKIDVCVCIFEDRVELYHDKKEKISFTTLYYPDRLTDKQYEHSAVEFDDVTGDGCTDITVKAETDAGLERSMTWIYEDGFMVYEDSLEYPPINNDPGEGSDEAVAIDINTETEAKQKMEDLSTILGAMAGGARIETDPDDPIYGENDVVKYVRVTDPRFGSIADVEEFISSTCTGSLRDELIGDCRKYFTEKDGKLYVETDNARGFYIFPLDGGILICRTSNLSFSATTMDADELNGTGSADFIYEDGKWLIESYSFF